MSKLPKCFPDNIGIWNPDQIKKINFGICIDVYDLNFVNVSMLMACLSDYNMFN